MAIAIAGTIVVEANEKNELYESTTGIDKKMGIGESCRLMSTGSCESDHFKFSSHSKDHVFSFLQHVEDF